MPTKQMCPIKGCDMWIQTKDYCGYHKKILADTTVKIRQGTACPFCPQGRIIKAGLREGKQLYKCGLCKKKCNKINK